MSWPQIQSYQHRLFSYLAISIGLLSWSQTPTLGQLTSPVAPVEIYQLATPQKLTIPPIAQSELSLTSKSESVSNPGDLFAPPSFNTSIVREFPNVWQMRVPVDQVASLYATYQLKAENGNGNAVSSEQRSDAKLPVILESLPIMEVSRDLNSNTAVVQGGFRLKMDISGAQIAGIYAGELTVVVERR
ncbi:hypothetical protein [Nostoc sp. TCL26-01]|uniref:hypothetical protein n=1 Tax=Nostoc sp. TCL26-01 TaxID=2576904 RepID=UPI0015BE7E24|nr:hypothetical protein [Nostoc sp. TCL26-01]QLE54144.1 hypothetical protein FD725_00545 [Nostoc sp. TCL26-01]